MSAEEEYDTAWVDHRGVSRACRIIGQRPSGTSIRNAGGTYPGIQYQMEWREDGKKRTAWTVTFPDVDGALAASPCQAGDLRIGRCIDRKGRKLHECAATLWADDEIDLMDVRRRG